MLACKFSDTEEKKTGGSSKFIANFGRKNQERECQALL
jgi:hypothetical protein